MTQDELVAALEPLVDRANLSDVLTALGRVCAEKAEHLRTNWQDTHTAWAWDNAEHAMTRAALSRAVRVVSL